MLTATDEPQAEAYRSQLKAKVAAKTIPAARCGRWSLAPLGGGPVTASRLLPAARPLTPRLSRTASLKVSRLCRPARPEDWQWRRDHACFEDAGGGARRRAR